MWEMWHPRRSMLIELLQTEGKRVARRCNDVIRRIDSAATGGYQVEIAVPRLIEEIAQCASLALEDAVALPAAAYVSQALFDLEKERIFQTQWLCVGRVDQIPAVGDYITYDIAGSPIYTINVDNDRYRSFHNVCRHRGTVLLEGSGNIARITCPYHAWCYQAADGQLLAARFMEDSKGFDKETIKLQEVRTEIWHGWIYVTLNDDEVSVTERLADLDQRLANYRMAKYRTLSCEDQVWSTNWKCLTDNFLDEYHPFHVHRETFGELIGDKALEVITQPGNLDAWTIHYMPMSDEMAHKAKQRFPSLTDWQAKHDALFGIYPTHLVNIMPGGPMFWLLLQPDTTSQVRVRFGVSVPDDYFDNAEESEDDVTGFYTRVNNEDKIIVEKVFRGLCSSHTQLGRLSRLEWSVWEFQKYLYRRLGTLHS